MFHYTINIGWTVDISEQTVDNLDGWWTNPEHSDFDQTGNYMYMYMRTVTADHVPGHNQGSVINVSLHSQQWTDSGEVWTDSGQTWMDG